MVQPHFESALAVAERLASTPEPLRCRWCSDVAHSSPASTSSVFDRAAAPLVCLEHQASQQSACSRWRWAESDLQSLAQLATGGSCVDARPTPVGMAAASAHQQQLWLPSHGKDSKTSLPRPIGVMCRGRECGSQQPASHVTSSSPHVVHAAHANGAYQQAVARDSGCGLSSSA